MTANADELTRPESLPLDFSTMVKTARHVVDSGARVPEKDLETTTLLMRGYLGLLIPELEGRLGLLGEAARASAEAGIGEARRRLDAGPGPLGPGRHAYNLARSVIALCTHLGHGQERVDTERAEPWTPPRGTTVEMVPAGRFWDAVRVRSHIGERVIQRLGANSGAVIEDWKGAVFYWLVPPGTTDAWTLPASLVLPLSVATFVAVPPVSYTGKQERLRWIVPLTETCYLTDPELLYDALTAEISSAAGPEATS
ncbi:DUF6415 family natural product biosynthesis protein [Streptomyces sp. NPDC059743]|uniref:DUF6415 family natural product biosynthesis protein n=1 Tax=Streptomyces sp. NPDC059743 TaxID=3346928 RepID=UPI0036657E08